MLHFGKMLPLLLCIIALAGCNSDAVYRRICGTPDVECWRIFEMPFESDTDYSAGGSEDVLLDVVFTCAKTGKSLRIPAFWDGGNTFLVRFAPVSTGKWEWASHCPEDASLDGLSGSLRCVEYTGDLDIYKHGFVKASCGTKYMYYADGTPFFYLGDTHWGMYKEEIDEAGSFAGDIRTDSHFKYIVDRRAEQGFTVYQSEPISSPFDLTDGQVDSADIEGFRQADRYYQHIADAGLVHANAEFFFASQMKPDMPLEKMSRYWVARYGAFPVLWTLAQEIDNDFYAERGHQKYYDYTCNPWVKVAEYIHKYDAYSHPLSGHQENAACTTVTGRGTGNCDFQISGGGVSVFASEETARRTGHNWWAVQWSPSLKSTTSSDIPLDYLSSKYPAVNYEGRYCGLWTKDFGARVQGWISFLTGFCGYGYGAIEMWLYKSTYDIDKPSFDGVDSISIADKKIPWSTAIEFDSAAHMGIMKNFFTSFDWWNLSPIFNGDSAFTPEEDSAWACAHTPGRYVLYFYGKNRVTGTLAGLKPSAEASLLWFNPRTGEQSDNISVAVSSEGKLHLPEKPDDSDWVLTVI